MKKLLPLVVLLLALAGCGGGGDEGGGDGGTSAEDAKAADSISSTIQKTSSLQSAGVTLTSSDADCIGKGFVDKIGRENLQKYGLIDKNDGPGTIGASGTLHMSAADARSAAQVLADCVDLKKILSDALSQGTDLTAKQKECVTDKLDEATLTKVFASVFQGKAPDTSGLSSIATCMVS
jgi:hypothetical protein